MFNKYYNKLLKSIIPPSRREKELIASLRSEIRALPDFQQTASIADSEWMQNRVKLRSLILERDPRSFLTWDVIKYTMFVGNAPYILRELDYLRYSPMWEDRYKQATIEDDCGSPEPCKHYEQSSGNLIHHAYTLGQYEMAMGVKVSEMDLVFEFGGGYGSMCRLFHRLGFRGLYIIYDFADFGALQRYYLRSLDLPVVDWDGSLNVSSGIVCVSDMLPLRGVLGQKENRLFLGTWSFSETPLVFRDEFMQTAPLFNHYLIGYQHTFGEVDNSQYFNEYVKHNAHCRWKSWEIPHLKGNYYLFGRSL